MTFKCRIVSEQFRVSDWGEFRSGDVLYSSRISLSEADGLVVLYDPSDELLRFRGPKVWFTLEPSWHHHFRSHPVGKRLIRELDETEHIFYGNPNEKYRVPHPTHHGPITLPRLPASEPAAVASVTNFGGRLWFLKRHIWLRNRMILCPLVKLYGNPKSWSCFSPFPFLWLKRPPRNFQGRSSPGNDANAEEHTRFLSGFKVAVCLENCVEENYFTEKFVNAVRAGCIPVYHAHPTVKKQFLGGAKWVDPADFGFSPTRTVAFALSQDQNEFRRVNDAWLASGALKGTDDRDIFPRLYRIIGEKLAASHAASEAAAK